MAEKKDDKKTASAAASVEATDGGNSGGGKKKKGTVLVRSLLPKRSDGGEDVVMRQGDTLVYSTERWTEVNDTAEVQEHLRLENLEEK